MLMYQRLQSLCVACHLTTMMHDRISYQVIVTFHCCHNGYTRLCADGTATYSEVGDMVQWGTVVYATQPYRSNLTQQIGDMAALRADFATNGSVSGPWDWAPGSVIAFSHDLGDVNGPDSPSNVTFTIGYVRDEAINYLGNSRANYWRGAGCDDINCAAVHVLLDYESADAEARVLDATIAAKANAAAGSKYADILALSTRQAFGSMDVTIPHNSLDTSDVMVFMKEISSTDDGAGSSPNQTNLAIKAAIALNAYGLMTGQSNYSDTGKRFATELYNNTLGTDPNRTHFTILEGEAQTWALAFNLFPDVLLGLNTFPTAAYAMQTAFYSTIRSLGGVALDSREDWGKTDWMLWAAATAMAPGVGNNSCRDMFIDDVWNFASNGMNEVPFGDKFFVETNGTDVEGMWDMYEARPVVGGHFALLAMQGHGILT
ncbi:hypothetical protein M8818_003068 [Zalaria obscura]|uniref:Uncharacterized protein n=1 Tax=Zalaria obscura TaxID=2024903 RepID=A0ACC3SGI4_9PEZI